MGLKSVESDHTLFACSSVFWIIILGSLGSLGKDERKRGEHTNSSFEESLGKLGIVHEQFSETCFLPRIEDYWVSSSPFRIGIGGLGSLWDLLNDGLGIAHGI
jgi:hypothetical protein